jgi:hypothetical protein
MACDRQVNSTACPNTCSVPPGFAGQAFVFSRKGECNPNNLLPVGIGVPPTHVGFGIEVAPNTYVFGSVEDTSGNPFVPAGDDNQFWMSSGNQMQMLAAFLNPRATQFHGAMKADPYDLYRYTNVANPSVCAAVHAAENLYNVGYNIYKKNCLDAVYAVLQAYGINFGSVTPAKFICPSGPHGWFTHLPSPPWTGSLPLSGQYGSPVMSVNCPTTTIASTCTSTTSSTISSQPALPECTSDPAEYASVSDYCKTLCRRVCAVVECSTTFLDEDFVSACYDGCACETEGLSFDGICVSGVGTPRPGLVYCYDTPGCPPNDGHYYGQGDLAGLAPGACPLGEANMITGN